MDMEKEVEREKGERNIHTVMCMCVEEKSVCVCVQDKWVLVPWSSLPSLFSRNMSEWMVPLSTSFLALCNTHTPEKAVLQQYRQKKGKGLPTRTQ